MRNAIAMLAVAVSSGLTQPASAHRSESDFDLPAGWEWELEPVQLRSFWRSSGSIRFVPSGTIMLNEGRDGFVFAQHVRTDDLIGERGSMAPLYQVYVYDDDGDVLPVEGSSTMSNAEMLVARYRLDVDGKPEGVARIGLAVLKFEGRKQQSALALRQAEEAGADVLPLPVIGEPFEFDLPTMEGGRVRSQDLQGKVVLIDCWATWCGPCMAKMPELKRVHQEYRDKGFVVIGVNFDQDIDTAQQAVEEKNLNWRHVHGESTARGIDDLWERATGITSIPRLFLIDGAGTLRDDFYPHELQEKVAALIETVTPAQPLATKEVVLSGLRFSAQPGWVRESPPSKARVAQYLLAPDSARGEHDTRLVVYYFGEKGAGTIDSNMARWIDQIAQPDGSDSKASARIKQRTVGGMRVDTIDLSGTYVAETRPGSGERLDRPGHRLVAAVVQTEAGPYYLKLVGPADIVERWMASWDAMLESLAPAPVLPTDAADHR